jgi:diguanylate cyclase (GGDEF)-like protein
MTDPAPAAVDASIAKTALRLVRGAVAMIAVLPPLVWAIALAFAPQRADSQALVSGWGGVVLVALASAALALAIWALNLRGPMMLLRQAERRLRTLSQLDTLTGLPNRNGLRLVLERSLQRWRRTRSVAAVLVIDVDRFRVINASMGPEAGDELLRSVAARIRAVVREGDLVARLGADQFAVHVEGIAGAAALAVMARNLLRASEPAHLVGGAETVVTLSIGFAIVGEPPAQPAHDVDSLLQNAEAAMRAAKAEGGGTWRAFEASMQVDHERRLDLDRRLRHALREGQFIVLYQPIVEPAGKRIVAAEALLRWADPQRGMVQPADFIPVLEQTGLIVNVGAWVLREACRQGVDWIEGGARSLVISVNVSPRQFAENNFVDTVRSILAQTGFPAAQLQLEVTEGLLLDPTPETLQKIGALVQAGVRMAIDDFGMGYSSLAFLKAFPLHTLKIDRLFVNGVAKRPRDAAIARAIIDLGHGLGLQVTAEGIESQAQFDVLRDLGCDALQGFLFAQPLPPAQMQALLEGQETCREKAEPRARLSLRPT